MSLTPFSREGMRIYGIIAGRRTLFRGMARKSRPADFFRETDFSGNRLRVKNSQGIRGSDLSHLMNGKILDHGDLFSDLQ